MSGDDWKPGDLALAVKCGARPLCSGVRPGHRKPRPGGVYTVEAVVSTSSGQLGLVLENHHSGHPLRGWAARCFRRIPPLTDEERDEFKAELDALVQTVLPLSSAGDAV